MICPQCKGKTLVKNTATDGKQVMRERQCKACKSVFYTEETIPVTSIGQLEARFKLYNIKEGRRRQREKDKVNI